MFPGHVDTAGNSGKINCKLISHSVVTQFIEDCTRIQCCVTIFRVVTPLRRIAPAPVQPATPSPLIVSVAPKPVFPVQHQAVPTTKSPPAVPMPQSHVYTKGQASSVTKSGVKTIYIVKNNVEKRNGEQSTEACDTKKQRKQSEPETVTFYIVKR